MIAAIQEALNALAVGTAGQVCGLKVIRIRDTAWNLWGPGVCGCSPPTRRWLTLSEAADTLSGWRPGVVPRGTRAARARGAV